MLEKFPGWSLLFRKRCDRANGVVQFTCTSCENIHGVVVSAFGEMNVEEDGTLSYSLNSYPSHSEHSCIRNGFENYMERGVMKMYQLVQENPHLEVPQIYNSCSFQVMNT